MSHGEGAVRGAVKKQKTLLKRMDKYNRAEHETFTTYVVPVLLAIIIKNKVY